jgi:hypothetical protein
VGCECIRCLFLASLSPGTSGRRRHACRVPAGREVNHSLAAGRLRLFRNLLSPREKRDWFRGARRLIRDRAKGLGLVQPRERESRRPEHLESIERTRWIGGIHRRRQDQMRVHVRMRSRTERRIEPRVRVLWAEAGCVERDWFLVAVLFQRRAGGGDSRRASIDGCHRGRRATSEFAVFGERARLPRNILPRPRGPIAARSEIRGRGMRRRVHALRRHPQWREEFAGRSRSPRQTIGRGDSPRRFKKPDARGGGRWSRVGAGGAETQQAGKKHAVPKAVDVPESAALFS